MHEVWVDVIFHNVNRTTGDAWIFYQEGLNKGPVTIEVSHTLQHTGGTLPETKFSYLKMDGLFSEAFAVSFRECTAVGLLGKIVVKQQPERCDVV